MDTIYHEMDYHLEAAYEDRYIIENGNYVDTDEIDFGDDEEDESDEDEPIRTFDTNEAVQAERDYWLSY